MTFLEKRLHKNVAKFAGTVQSSKDDWRIMEGPYLMEWLDDKTVDEIQCRECEVTDMAENSNFLPIYSYDLEVRLGFS